MKDVIKMGSVRGRTSIVAVHDDVQDVARLEDEHVQEPTRVRPTPQLDPIPRCDVGAGRDVVPVELGDEHGVWGCPGEAADVRLGLPEPQARAGIRNIVQLEDGEHALVLEREYAAALGAGVREAAVAGVAAAAARHVLADDTAGDLLHRTPAGTAVCGALHDVRRVALLAGRRRRARVAALRQPETSQ